jgi:hypothetical protein
MTAKLLFAAEKSRETHGFDGAVRPQTNDDCAKEERHSTETEGQSNQTPTKISDCPHGREAEERIDQEVHAVQRGNVTCLLAQCGPIV